MATTRFKGETAGERLDYSSISDNDMIQLRHKPGTIDDADKGISKANLQSCPFGVSDTAVGTAAKTASLTDSNPDFTLVSGREIVVCFTTANTAGNPTLNFAGSGAIPLYMPNGAPVGAWNAGAWMHLKYFYATIGNSQIQRWILMSQEVDNEVIMASSTTLTGKSLLSGSSIKVMFTADIAGSNTSTVLSLTYNGTAYNVKVGKNGALSNFVASEVSSGVYKYVQAYTTLELAFDGSQFVIIGNPVVLSSADYTIYADGLQRVNTVAKNDKNMVTSDAVYEYVNRLDVIVPRVTQQFSKVTIALDSAQAYVTTIIALMTRGGGLCLIGLSGQDSGTKPNIVKYLSNDGQYKSYFYYRDIGNKNKIELYWTGSAYSTKDSIAILTNKSYAEIEDKSYVSTLPADVISL